MIKRFIQFFAVLSVICACNQTPQRHNDEATVLIQTKAPQQMDALEKIFNNDNWMRVTDGDTSYINFSRNQNITRVYNYKISKGDSINTVVTEIKVMNDTLQWQINKDASILYLDRIDSVEAEWKPLKTSTGLRYIIYKKKSDKEIAVTENVSSYLLIKTLPLSTFLVRSRYDFMHRTKYAFSDTQFILRPNKNR